MLSRTLHTYIHYVLVLLGWLVGKEEVNLVVMEPGYLINEESMELIPNNVVDGVMDENVGISLIRKYFTPDACMLKEDVVTQKRRKLHFTCIFVRKLLVRVVIG